MNNYETIYDAEVVNSSSALMKDVYWWMALALLVTGGTAWVTATVPAITAAIFSSTAVIIGLCIAEFALVMILSAAINKLSFVQALSMFLVYSVLNGLTMSSILLLYTAESVAGTFLITAGTFGACALYGTITKRDLSGLGSFFMISLIGIIIATVVNMFLHSSGLYMAITYFGVLLFAGLTAYDTQKIRAILAQGYAEDEMTQKIVILGALSLYLDFVNLFLYLIRLFGKRR